MSAFYVEGYRCDAPGCPAVAGDNGEDFQKWYEIRLARIGAQPYTVRHACSVPCLNKLAPYPE